MDSPRYKNEHKTTAIKPHAPKQPIETKPQPPRQRTSNTNRPQSARIVRERTMIFGNMVSKLHTIEVEQKKQQTKAMWKHIRNENKRFEAPGNMGRCADLEGETMKHTRMSFSQPVKPHPITLDLPLANIATCEKLASELMPRAVRPPEIDDESTNSYCVQAKYNRTLDEQQRQVFRARYSSTHRKLNHRLSNAVQEQYVHIARRNQAWTAFCASSRIYSDDPEQLKRTEFAAVARNIGIDLHDAQYDTISRRLDKNITGFIAWRDFYAWFLDEDWKNAMNNSAEERRASCIV